MKKTAPQLAFKIRTWGGKRRGAGRPNRSGRVNHMKRARVNFNKPLFLTLKLRSTKWNLRCGEIAAAFKKGASAAQKFGLRILHYSLQGDHIHLIVEAKDNSSLSRGMKSLGSCLGKAIRAVYRGTGPVFKGRFHLNVMTNPTQMRNTLAYVLQNFSKHSRLLNHLDAYSSASYFTQWKKLLGKKTGPILESIDGPSLPLPDYLCYAKSWLAREGWRRARPALEKKIGGAEGVPTFT